MSVITIPAAVAATVGGQSYGQNRYDSADVSDATGGAFTVAYGPPRWAMSLRSAQAMSLANAGAWEAMVLKLRGGINHVALYDFLRPAPVGTMRGAPYIAAGGAAQGATAITLDNVIGTILPGDWVGLGAGLGASQLVKCTELATSAVSATGAFSWTLSAVAFSWTLGGSPFTWSRPGAQVTFNFEPPLRQAFVAFSAALWDKPVAYYKLTNSTTSWQARANGPAIDGFALDLLEQWA